MGGTEWCQLRIMRGLADRGWGVRLLHEEGGDLLSEWAAIAETRSTGSLWFGARVPRSSLSAARIAFETRRPADVTYIHVDAHLPFGYIRRHLAGGPLVYHLHMPLLARPGRLWRHALRSADKVIAVSADAAASWTAAIGLDDTRVSVVHNGVDLDEFRPAPTRRRRGGARLLFVGRIAPEKGVFDLLEAFDRLRAADRTYELTLLGDVHGGHFDAGRAAVFRSQVASACERLGALWVPRVPDVLPHLWEADIVVAPSTWPEPFGLTLIEAMAAGVPVVATRVGGVPEVVPAELEEFLAPPGNAAALARTIELARRRLGRDEGLGARLRKHVERRFSLETMVSGVEAVLVEATHERTQTRNGEPPKFPDAPHRRPGTRVPRPYTGSRSTMSKRMPEPDLEGAQ